MEISITLNSRNISLVQGDITIEETDAIVNAANSGLMGGGGVDGAIHRAGGPQIVEECRKILAETGRLPAGKSVITSGGKLKARFVIHTVGPVWRGGHNREEEVLSSAYRESLKLAEKYDLKSLSFPSISTGAYGYPVDMAAVTATGTVADFLQNEAQSLSKVHFVLFDHPTYMAYAEALSRFKGSPWN